MRRLVAAGLCVFFQAFVLAAPLLHAHPDGHDEDHHHGTAVHAHLGGHAHAHEPGREAPAYEAEPDRAVYLPLFISEPLTAFDLPASRPQTFTLHVPDETAGHRAAAVTHGHDPPDDPATPPRAPPGFPTFI